MVNQGYMHFLYICYEGWLYSSSIQGSQVIMIESSLVNRLKTNVLMHVQLLA